MRKKSPGMTPEEQSEKFKKLARDLEAAGELSTTEARKMLDGLVRKQKK